MSSNASDVYVALGQQVVEQWTELEREYRELRVQVEEAATEEDRDIALRHLHDICIRLDSIEKEAGIEGSKRTT
jgi:hypothetical protein